MNRRTVLGLAGGAASAVFMTEAGVAKVESPDLVRMDAVDLAHAIRTRKVSCIEVMTAYLDHIARFNPKANAIVALQDRDALLAEAREKDSSLAKGGLTGPLHGFPHAVKDLQPVKGIRTTLGSPIFKDSVPTTDALMVGRLRKAGAIFIGKTNTPELGLGSNTFNPVYGATPNAYDASRTCGGSSGGAAVALALRMVPLADGSDYGGSLRNPAGWNNVFGFRNSLERVAVDTRDLFLPSISVNGPMARTIADLALLFSVQAGYDDHVPLSLDGNGQVFLQSLEADFKGTRIAWLGDFKGAIPYEPEVQEVCRAALKRFEEIGCIVEEAVPDYPIEEAWQAFRKIRAWQQGSNLQEHYRNPAHRALLKPEAIFEVEEGMKLSAFDISNASYVRSDWYRAAQRLFERYDFFLMPTAQVFPFDIDLRWPKEIAGHQMATYHEWMKAVCLISLLGGPALAVPAGFSAGGLPIGLQIVGKNRQDMACLKLGRAYERVAGQTIGRLPPLLGG